MKKILKREISIKNIYLLLMSLLILMTIFFLQNTISQAQENNTPNFIEMESRYVQEDKFSITFPTIPRKIVVHSETEGYGGKTTNYQANDETGLYTFSLGELKDPINDKQTQKYFIKNLFDTLFSAGEDAELYDCEESDEYPYPLQYIYTSTHEGIGIIHIGMISFIDNRTYIKITLLCPVILLENMDKFFENYSNFLESLYIK